MSEDTKMGRRLTDLSNSSEIVNLMLEMQQNSIMLKNVVEKVQGVPELTRKVDVLVTQMDVISEEVDSIQKLKELVDWHERLWKMIASLCMLLFPTLLASVFWMWTQIAQLQQTQSIQEYKLQYMEKLNEKSTKSSDIAEGVNELAWNFWYFDSARAEKLSFLRVAMEEQYSEPELYPCGKVHLHL